MPAPLGNTPTKRMPRIDVLGTERSAATRAAVRFFRSRRIVVRFVDISKQPIDAADFRAFLDRLGPGGLLTEPPEPAGAIDRGALLARARTSPDTLRLPIVRHEKELTAGPAESTWKAWLDRRTPPAAKPR